MESSTFNYTRYNFPLESSRRKIPIETNNKIPHNQVLKPSAENTPQMLRFSLAALFIVQAIGFSPSAYVNNFGSHSYASSGIGIVGNALTSFHQISEDPQFKNRRKSITKLQMSSEEHNKKKESMKNPSPKSISNELIRNHSAIIKATSMLGISSSLVLIWSEISIALTRCGPLLLPDAIERAAYLAVFIIASGTNLSKIIFGESMTQMLLADDNSSGCASRGIRTYIRVGRFAFHVENHPLERQLFVLMETLAFVSIMGAFGVLAWQVMNGDAFAEGAGFSGIDIRWCRLTNE